MIKIEEKNNKLYIYTPYNSHFVKKIKQIGCAKWIASKKCWEVPTEMIGGVREILLSVYGYNDITVNETISLKVIVNEEITSSRSDVVLFGKILAHATSRDSGAVVGKDVCFIKGGAFSTGSSRNWESAVKKDSEILLTNVNINLYKREKVEYDVRIEETEQKVNKAQLLLEKENLLKRIAEINKLLC